jgi:hypothetical protein
MPDLDTSILDHCTGRQLKELLALASAIPEEPRNWMLEVGDLEQLGYLIAEMVSDSGQSGSHLVTLACSPATTLDTLVAIKSTAKRVAAIAEAPDSKAAAKLLYHLSVASALAHYGRNISSNDPAQRLPFYKELAAELCDDELAAVFEKAIAALSSGAR